MDKSTSKETPVVVTTQHRGVFFGYAENPKGPTIQLRQARMAVYWSSDLRGVFGLASHGPGAQCKIGHAVDVELYDVTSVMRCSDEAVQRWEAAPWR